MRGSRALRGGLLMISKSGGLKPKAVAGKPSVTRLTQSSWTGMRASGNPRAAVRKMLHTKEARLYKSTKKCLVCVFQRSVQSSLPDNLAHVWGDEVSDELFHVVINGSAFLDCSYNGGEVVISKHHLRGGLGHSSAGAHGNTNFSLL